MSETPFHDVFVANEDLSTHQFKVMVNSAGQLVGRVGTAGAFGIGILQTKPNSGRTASVKVLGKTPMQAGGTIVAGANLTTTASGTVTTAASGDYILGNAFESVASGSQFDGFITHAGFQS